MKHMLLLFALAAPAAIAEEPKESKEARALFDAMEAKLAAAKTLQVVCKAAEPREKGDRHDVTVRAAGGKARLEFDWWAASKGAVKWTVVSDGKRVWTTQGARAEGKAGGDPLKAIAVGFARTGTMALNDVESAMTGGADPGDGKEWVVSGFKLGKKETKDGATLQAVEYAVQKGKADPWKFVLWIDVKTQLPKKRDVDISGWVLVETYDVQLDAKVDEASFTKPK